MIQFIIIICSVIPNRSVFKVPVSEDQRSELKIRVRSVRISFANNIAYQKQFSNLFNFLGYLVFFWSDIIFAE